MVLLNVRFTFVLRTGSQKANGSFPVMVRIFYNKERVDIATGLFCRKGDWNGQHQRANPQDKDLQKLNRTLDSIERQLAECYEEAKRSGSHFSARDLANKARGSKDEELLLLDYLEAERQRLQRRINVDASFATVDKYRRSAKHLQDFLKHAYQKKNYPLSRVDDEFLNQFFQYLRINKSLSNNSAVRYMTCLKTIFMPLIKKGIWKSDPFAETRFRMKTVHKSYLSMEDVRVLEQLALSADLSRIRDQFLFSCFTGLAYIDLKQLKSVHILKNNDGTYYIRKPRQKTGQESVIPLLPAAIRILQSYSETKDFRDFEWHVSANQKMNQRLKTIAEKAKLERNIHMHMARHTFATTITLSNGIPLETVSNMLGHSNLKQTQHYAKILATKVKDDMKKLNDLFK